MTEENVADHSGISREQSVPIATSSMQETVATCPSNEEQIGEPAGIMNPEGI